MKKALLLITLALTLLSTPAMADTDICACAPKRNTTNYLEDLVRGRLDCNSATGYSMETTMQEMIEQGWKLTEVVKTNDSRRDVVYFFKK